jgi:ABC-type transport system involved in cytochrome bd biosynthesis fused ATPase/permease subunit
VPDATPLNGYSIEGNWTKETWLTGSVSYAPQQAYIRHGTIRDNILFGQPMWRARYKEVLRQCSLLGDLELLADGDMTEVGDQGVNLVSLPMAYDFLNDVLTCRAEGRKPEST